MKMNVHKIFLSLIILLLSTQIVTSQKHSQNSQRSNQNSNSVETIEKQMVKIQEKLGLDGLQAVLVERVLQKYATKKKELRKQPEDRQVMRAKMRDLNTKQNEELSEILTEDQMLKFKKIFKEKSMQKNVQSQKGSRKGSGSGRGMGRGSRNF